MKERHLKMAKVFAMLMAVQDDLEQLDGCGYFSHGIKFKVKNLLQEIEKNQNQHFDKIQAQGGDYQTAYEQINELYIIVSDLFENFIRLGGKLTDSEVKQLDSELRATWLKYVKD